MTLALSSLTAADVATVDCKPGEPCLSWTERASQTVTPPTTGEISGSTLEWSRVSNRTIEGLGPNERLCPTECPVGVMAPDGSQILDCYKICTPVNGQATSPVNAQMQTMSATGTYAVQSVTLPVYRYHMAPVLPVYPVQPMVYYAYPRIIAPVPVMRGCVYISC